jgi:hypothetical protein
MPGDTLSGGNLRLTEVWEGNVHEYVAPRKDRNRLCNRDINLELTFLRSCFKLAKIHHLILHNPAKEVTTLTEVHDEKWVPNASGAQSVLLAFEIRCAASDLATSVEYWRRWVAD